MIENVKASELYKQVAENPNIGLLVLDKYYNMVEVNSFIIESTHFMTSDLIGKCINMLISTHDHHDSFTNIVKGGLRNNEPLAFKHEIRKANGEFFWAHINGVIYEEYSVWLIVPTQNINKKEEAVKEIIASIYKKDDVSFMDAMTLQLSKTLNADHTFIGEIQDATLSVRTLSHCMDKKIVEGFEYNLKDTPCELVYDGQPSIFPQNVRTLFPKDQDIKNFGIEGYAGIPLFNEKQETFGLIVALYREPIEDPEFIHSTISLFANIIANEYERQKAEKAIREQAIYYQSILDGINEPLMVIDEQYNIVLMNQAAENKKLKKNIQEDRYPKCYEVSHNLDHPCDGIHHPCSLKTVMETKKALTVTHNHPDENGVPHFVELTVTPLYDKNHDFIGIIEASKDITEQIYTRKQLEEYKDKLHYEEHYNTLTHLPNRILFYDRIEQAKKQSQKEDLFAILFIDVDNFKAINDSLGLDAGNEILKAIVKDLKEFVTDKDSIAHFGADEFGIVLQEVKNINGIIDYVDRLVNLFKKPFFIGDNKLYITLSIGISIYPEDSSDSGELVKFADVALHKAKTNGKNRYEFYTKDLTEAANKRIVLENNLREAILNEDLVVHFQPKVDALSDKIVGMEALVRWNHKEQGLLTPNHFIPLAEEIKVIAQIDLWMIQKVAKTIAHWHGRGLQPGLVSINITLQTLMLKNFKDILREILQNHQCDPSFIELEITENQLMDNPNETISILNELQQLGIQISVDDFGTGYSSLAYLKKLPIDTLKIDKTFIDDLPHNEEDVAICKTIIALAKSLKLEIVAEGVENKEQRDFLLENECSVIQGYFYYKPLAMDVIERLLEN